MHKNCRKNDGLRLSELMALVLLPVSAVALADEPSAIAALNGQGSISYDYVDTEYDPSPYGIPKWTATQSTPILSGQVNVPLWHYLGASALASVGYAKKDFEADASPYFAGAAASCTDPHWSLGGSAFARKIGLGRVGGSYTRGRSFSCGWSSSEGSISQAFTTTDYGADIEGYWGRMTISADYKRQSTDYGIYGRVSGNLYRAQLAAYPSVEWRLVGKYTHIPESDGTYMYGFNVEYQPEQLGNRWAVQVRYQRLNGDFNASDTYGISILYYFGPAVDLLTRDREYR